MGLYEQVEALPLQVDGYELEGLKRAVSNAFVRRTTLIHLLGSGQTGTGEDVTYDGADHERLQAAGPALPLPGSYTLGGFSSLLELLDLFPAPPAVPTARLYRRWAFESAALDLALRQTGTSLESALGLEPRAVTFVVSMRLGDPPSTEPLRRVLDLRPELRFKLDPTSAWDERLVAELADLDVVAALDLKGAYRGTIVDQPPDPGLYSLVARAFPDAWIEDPDLTDAGAAAALASHHDRITWDAPIHSVADIEALSFEPGALNIKPSRFGSLRELLAAYAHCAARGIALYGGGQFELGVGRGQIQYLASLLHADAPNDVAPGGYNLSELPSGLPGSPLLPPAGRLAFFWPAA